MHLLHGKVNFFPTHHPLFNSEHVKLYAGIKGLSKEDVEAAASLKLAEVGLSEFDSDRLSSTYSGGMKRKLSVACATIANPKIGKFSFSMQFFTLFLTNTLTYANEMIVFLDEPSTGMVSVYVPISIPFHFLRFSDIVFGLISLYNRIQLHVAIYGQ